MAFEGISYPIDDYTRELDELDRIFYLDRLFVDINTNSADVTPALLANFSTYTFTALNNSTRTIEDVTLDRIGPASEVQLRFDLSDDVNPYAVDLVIRPLDLGINVPNVPTSGGPLRRRIRGRAADPSTSLTWDIHPFDISPDSRVQNPIIKYFYVDIVTGAETVTPVLVFDDDTTSSLTGITNAARAISEFTIGTTNRLKRLRLDGDFTNSAIIVYDLELDVYVSRSQLF